MINEEERELVRRSTDFLSLVSETVLLRQGRGSSDFWGCCPFHQEKTASFHINPSTGLWYCFSCHKGGDLFKYVMEREQLDFPDAIRYLADRAGIELHEVRSQARGPKRNRLVEALEFARDYYNRMLLRGKSDGADACRRYLSGRGFGSEICKKWKLGFSPGQGSLVRELRQAGFTNQEILGADLAVERNGQLLDRFYDRAMFPITDEQGRCIAFGGRILGDGQPKYLNSRETRLFQKSTKLFGFDRAKDSIVLEQRAVVVEGYTDVISLHEAGMTNVVATLGTALTEQHLKLLSRFARTIVYMFDGDAAGQKAAESALRYIDKTEASMLCVVLPDGLDPADFIAQRGIDALRAHVEHAQPLLDFVFEKRLASYDLSVPGRRVAAFNELVSLLAPLKNSVVLDDYASRLADALGMDFAQTRKKIREAPIVNQDGQNNYPQTLSQQRSSRYQQGRYQQGSAPVHAGQQGYGGQSAYAGQQAYGGQQTYQGQASQTGQPSQLPSGVGGYDESALSLDDRNQLAAERELLALIARSPDVMRQYEARFSELYWVDSRHKAMADAMFKTARGTAPSELVQAAESVCADAQLILASAQHTARLKSDAREDVQELAEFELLTAELASARRQIRVLRHQMDNHSIESPDALLKQATELQKKVIYLEKKLSSSNNS